MLKAIHGYRLTVDRLRGHRKLLQHKSAYAIRSITTAPRTHAPIRPDPFLPNSSGWKRISVRHRKRALRIANENQLATYFAGSYAKRPIRFLELALINGWRVKTYGISIRGELPDSRLIHAAKRLAGQKLPDPPIHDGSTETLSQDRYGVALLIVHEGREGGFVLIDWWVGENMLQHHVYFSSDPESHAFEYVNPTGIMACVWELRVLAFKRQAWIDCVLANDDGADLNEYCRRQFSDDI